MFYIDDLDYIVKLSAPDFKLSSLICVYQFMCTISTTPDNIKYLEPIYKYIPLHINYAVKVKNKDLIMALIHLLYYIYYIFIEKV